MWMRQEKTVYQLTFMPRFFPVNCYLVEEEDSLTLIDSALPYSAKGILAAARKIGKPITRIILTHAHDDHVGALDKLKEMLPDAQVYISRRDDRLLKGDRSLDPDEPQTPIRGGVSNGLRTRPDILLEDGDRIGSLLAVAAPGHTPGSMALLDSRSRILICGDAFQVRGGLAVAGQLRLRFPFPMWGTWSKEKALETAHRLRNLEPSVLAAGHGRMLVRPVNGMDRVIQEAENNLDKAGRK